MASLSRGISDAKASFGTRPLPPALPLLSGRAGLLADALSFFIVPRWQKRRFNVVMGAMRPQRPRCRACQKRLSAAERMLIIRSRCPRYAAGLLAGRRVARDCSVPTGAGLQTENGSPVAQSNLAVPRRGRDLVPAVHYCTAGMGADCQACDHAAVSASSAPFTDLTVAPSFDPPSVLNSAGDSEDSPGTADSLVAVEPAPDCLGPAVPDYENAEPAITIVATEPTAAESVTLPAVPMAQDDTPAVEDSRMSSEPASDRSEPETSMADRTNDAPVSPSEDIVSEDIAVERAGPEPEPPSAAVARSSNTATKDEDRTESPLGRARGFARAFGEPWPASANAPSGRCSVRARDSRAHPGKTIAFGRARGREVLRQLREACQQVDARCRRVPDASVAIEFRVSGTHWCAAWTSGIDARELLRVKTTPGSRLPHGRPRREAGRNARPAGRRSRARGPEASNGTSYLALWTCCVPWPIGPQRPRPIERRLQLFAPPRYLSAIIAARSDRRPTTIHRQQAGRRAGSRAAPLSLEPFDPQRLLVDLRATSRARTNPATHSTWRTTIWSIAKGRPAAGLRPSGWRRTTATRICASRCPRSCSSGSARRLDDDRSGA